VGQRKSFEVEGYGHGANPIPAVARIGSFIASGGISGRSLANGKLAESLDGQCKLMFELMKIIAETAGVTTDEILKVTIYLRSGLSRDPINQQWVQYFPELENCPVRHVLINDNLPDKMLVQCEFMAVAPSG
tara:strand:- start:501 stop:896 length:396 start_codon:yes stop_codon:yes gene_type:complete